MLLKAVLVAGDDPSLALLNFLGFLERKDKVRGCGTGVLAMGEYQASIFLFFLARTSPHELQLLKLRMGVSVS
jgi:hypothetical protein